MVVVLLVLVMTVVVLVVDSGPAINTHKKTLKLILQLFKKFGTLMIQSKST